MEMFSGFRVSQLKERQEPMSFSLRRLARGSIWAIATFAILEGTVFCKTASATLTYTLSTTFNGSSPTSAAPWLTAEFKNNGSGGVDLTLTSGLEVTSEYIDEVAFNVKSSILPSSVTVAQTPGEIPFDTGILHTTQNAQDLTGGGAAGMGFDFKITWSNANSGGGVLRFNAGEINTFKFSLTGLTESDFDFTNTGSANAHFAAHIAGIPGNKSGAIKDTPDGVTFSTPEPATTSLALSGLAAFGLMGLRRIRRRETTTV